MSILSEDFLAHLSELTNDGGAEPFPPLPPGVSPEAVSAGGVIGTARSAVTVSDQEELASVEAPPGSRHPASPLCGRRLRMT